ncbi:hypothetical protein [Zavarzinella formosa]|uniref:hypothetical protein n=1 Tax=Zavarzinella formosa TaxID=360055 RepID=UPI0002EB2920|nr:hypothetical protein [Zavarzinella formosa]
MKSLTAEQWADIDSHIFRGYLVGVIRIREFCGVSLNEAKGIHWDRYKQLRIEHDAEFGRTDAEYCEGILE